MAIGLGTSRSARVGHRGAGTGTGTSRPTIREVCLIGRIPARDEGWTTGQEVTWQGRDYRIVATAPASARTDDDGSCIPSPRQYIYLAPCDGD
ncbi:MAG: hypothetical protein ACLQGP_41900 [Isosphaeraceae bacterium]